MKKVEKVDVKEAIEAVERLEAATGVAVKTGLRAGGGISGTGDSGPPNKPLYGAPNSSS